MTSAATEEVGDVVKAPGFDGLVPLLAPLFCALIALVARLQRLDIPLERDEGEYAYIGQLLWRGVAPYTEAYTMKLPGVPAIYAAFFGVFGETARAAHAAGLVADVGSALGVASIAAVVGTRRRLVTTVAGCTFFFLSSLLCFEGLTANCEKFVVVFVVSALAVLTRGRGRRALVLAGLLGGLAFVCKQQALPFLVLLVAACWWQRSSVRARSRFVDVIILVVAMGAPYLAMVAAIVVWGDFDAFWFQTVTYARAYVSTSETPVASLLSGLTPQVQEPLVLLAFVAFVASVFTQALSRHARLALIALFAASTIALSIGLLFRAHYFFYWVAPLSLATALLTTTRKPALVLLAASFVLSTIVNLPNFFTIDDDRLVSFHYGTPVFSMAPYLAEELRDRTTPDERILIIGNEPEVLFFAERRSVTPYIYLYPLREPQPFAEAQRREVLAAADAARPRYVVVSAIELKAFGTLAELDAWRLRFLADYEVVWPVGPFKRITPETIDDLPSALMLLQRR